MKNKPMAKMAKSAPNVSSRSHLGERAPRLRFPDFKGDWERRKLGDFVARITRKNGKATDIPLTISAQYGLVDQRTYFSKSVASTDMSGYYLLKTGEFAYNRSSSGEYPFGSIKRLENYEQGAVSTLYLCFSPVHGAIDSEYLKWYFASPKWHRAVGMISAEGARNHGLLNVPTDGFFGTEHFVPKDKMEQVIIARFIALLDVRVAAQRKLVELLKKHKRGVIDALFTPDATWTTSRFEDVFTILRNNTLSRDCLDAGTGDVYNIHYGDVLIKFDELVDVMSDGVPVIKSSVTLSRPDFLQNGDVVFADTAEDYDVGKVVEIFDCRASKVVSGLHTIPCRPKYRFAQGFLGFYLNSRQFRKNLMFLVQGTKVSSISKSALKGLTMCFPDEHRQKRIATILRALTQRINGCESALVELEQTKKGLLQQLFV